MHYELIDANGTPTFAGPKHELELLAAGLDGVRVRPVLSREELEEKVIELENRIVLVVFEVERIVLS
jgi:hypothetical protein